MEPALWAAKTGLDAQQTQMTVTANNLANVSTTGFKASRGVFEDLLYQNVTQVGSNTSQTTQSPSGLQLGLLALQSAFPAGVGGQLLVEFTQCLTQFRDLIFSPQNRGGRLAAAISRAARVNAMTAEQFPSQGHIAERSVARSPIA